MLTVDLVRIKFQQNLITPRYIKITSKSFLDVAETLIEMFQNHDGKSRGALKDCFDELVGQSPNALVYRGLFKLLEDRCEFDATADLDPIEVRRFTFGLSANKHKAGEFSRQEILAQTAEHFKISSEIIERCLFADLKGNHVILDFKNISPEKLLKRYNTALAQALLLKASSLEIIIRETDILRYRQLFRAIKFHRLLYKINGTIEDGFNIALDGPMSIFRASQKYGLQMALFLPALLLCENWKLQAEIQWKKSRKLYNFQLKSEEGLYSHYPDTGMYIPPELKGFAERFQNYTDEWVVSDHGDFIELSSQQICIPDYIFEHKETGEKVLLEIFGFWRQSALEKRLEILANHKEYKMVLAVSKKLNVDEKVEKDSAVQIYYFSEVLIPRQVNKCLKQALIA